MLFCFWKLSRHKFLCRNKHFHLQHLYFVATFFLLFFSNFVTTEFSHVATELLWLLNNLCRGRVFFCRNRLFFSSPYRWLSCLLRHRNFCYNRLDLANLSSLSISITTKIFYHSAAFIVARENFFVATEILPSIIHYAAT